MELQFNGPLYNEILGIRNNFFSLAKIVVKCMKQNLDLMKSLLYNTIHRWKDQIYLYTVDKCQHVIKDECQTDQQG